MVFEKRRANLFRHVDVGSRVGLEIGPYHNPTVRKDEGDVRYLDFYSREELLATQDVKRPEDARVHEVDYVVKSDDYYRWVDERFDYVIANHVLEHVDNPVQWLIDLGRLLRPGGVLFLAVPDKKYNFDRFRSDTTLSHLLADYFRGGGEPSEHGVELELFYDTTYVGQPLDLRRKLDPANLRSAFHAAPHPGRHNHVFQSETFVARILRPLQYAGLWPYTLLDFGDAPSNYGEFHLILREGPEEVELRPADVFGHAAGEGPARSPEELEELLARSERELERLRAELARRPFGKARAVARRVRSLVRRLRG